MCLSRTKANEERGEIDRAVEEVRFVGGAQGFYALLSFGSKDLRYVDDSVIITYGLKFTFYFNIFFSFFILLDPVLTDNLVIINVYKFH